MPHKAGQVRKRITSFCNWLESHGAEILEPETSDELLRFRTHKGISTLKRDRRERLTWSGPDIKEAWNCYRREKPWMAVQKTPRKRQGSAVINALRRMYGDDCLYCGLPVDNETASVEHILSLAHGGADTIQNKALVHRSCNQQFACLPVPEKFRLRDKKRNEAKDGKRRAD